MEPILKTLPLTRLVGMHKEMSLANNQTFALWSAFMPRRKEVINSLNTGLFSMQLYDTTYFENFSLDRKFTKWAAVAVDNFESIPDGMESYTIEGGEYAVFTHKGGPETGAEIFGYIFNTWLPNSDYALDNREHFELLGDKYKHGNPESEEEIWIPVKPKTTDKTKIAVALFDKLADRYQDKYMDVGLYADSLNLFCDNILKPNASILELACGPGNVTKYLLEKRPDFKILATDLAPRMIELAKANNPSATFKLMDCRDLGKAPKNYDGIVAAFCLPYLSKEETQKLIADAYNILEQDGLLFISTMENDYEKSGWEKGSSGDAIYMHYYPADFLLTTLQTNGFTIIDERRKKYNGPTNNLVTDLLLIARKEEKRF
ncbi:putative transcriptional regulator YdeE/ubiquinone/menaquinone biosynthesis C-methylase UbiE [Flavobacterium sp. 28YEA47A]|uniref:GyrI-like domain-containing protein n=1 Tax=Flavobacterium sp. 28YEA47A TaxID=3156276 RepID=UPI00351678DC